VTRHPTSVWIVQQLREAFPYEPAIKFLILDHDAKYGTEVPGAIPSMNIATVRTAVGCPWQNGVAERWVGSCRRELLDRFSTTNCCRKARFSRSRLRCDRKQRVSRPNPNPT
jgi:transposase InsO family protein